MCVCVWWVTKLTSSYEYNSTRQLPSASIPHWELYLHRCARNTILYKQYWTYEWFDAYNYEVCLLRHFVSQQYLWTNICQLRSKKKKFWLTKSVNENCFHPNWLLASACNAHSKSSSVFDLKNVEHHTYRKWCNCLGVYCRAAVSLEAFEIISVRHGGIFESKSRTTVNLKAPD